MFVFSVFFSYQKQPFFFFFCVFGLWVMILWFWCWKLLLFSWGFQENSIGEAKDMEEAISISINSDHTCSKPVLERKARPQKDQAVNCPRCSSTNTKFCYYNNYSLTQPRYFCKTCRRYWTEGGTLRNVPVGGGSRKNKRSITTSSSLSSSLTSSSSFKTHLPDLNPPILSHFSSENPRIHEPHDLNLAFPLPQYYHGISQFAEVPKIENNNCSSSSSSSSSSTLSHLSALELLKTGITSRGLSSFVPAPMPDSSSTLFTSGFPLQEFKVPHLSFSAHLHGVDPQQNMSTTGRVLFPFGEVKQLPATTSTGVDHDCSGNNKGQGSPATAAYWNNGMFGGGGGRGGGGGGGGSW